MQACVIDGLRYKLVMNKMAEMHLLRCKVWDDLVNLIEINIEAGRTSLHIILFLLSGLLTIFADSESFTHGLPLANSYSANHNKEEQ